MIQLDKVRFLLTESLDLARQALDGGNYPIGAIFTDETGEILVSATNQCTTQNDVTAHAEVLGIRMLGERANKDSSSKTLLFTSLEPCYGCSFFLARTNVIHISSALKDPHKGGLASLKEQQQFEKTFKNIEIENDLFEDLRDESKTLMRKYFLSIGREDAAAFYE